jgi:hypothetical protein
MSNLYLFRIWFYIHVLYFSVYTIRGGNRVEVGLITLGGVLIIASFEIQFRYLETAKQYYDNVLKKISFELDELIKKKDSKSEKESDPEVGRFLEQLNRLLSRFTIEKDRANFPNHLFLGFLSMGIYIVLLGLLYDFLLSIWNLPNTKTSSPGGSMILAIFMFGLLLSLFIVKGLISLRKITKIS